MKNFIKNIAALLSVVFVFNLVGVSIASADFNSNETLGTASSEETSKSYSDQLDDVYEEYLQNELPYLPELQPESEIQPMVIGPIIGQLVKFTFQQLAKRGTSAAVSVTARSVATNITKHAIEEAIKDGITTVMIDNLLSNKATGMWAIEKYYDINTGARVVHDPNNKLIAILDKDENNMFTIYSDNGKNTINDRVNVTKRWWKSSWIFK